jgi:hypothetical protein
VAREKWLDPSNWASLKPFGMGEEHPNNYLELWNAFKENRDQARYAWRILTQGTCDGCALAPRACAIGPRGRFTSATSGCGCCG